MKKLFYLLFIFLPVVVSSQFNLYKDSPLDYAWKYVGNAGFSAGGAVGGSLAFSTSGQPYVAYTDWENFGRATVMKFDGTNWVNVGNAGFSNQRAIYTSLAFSPNDSLPYVAYQDIIPTGSQGYATVMKFDGTNWVYVGNQGFSSEGVLFTRLAFSPSNGQPYVAYIEDNGGGAGKATVMKFDGTNWVYVGNEGFSADDSYYTSLAFSSSGQPYVAYMDGGDTLKITVMTFNGTNWVNVGNEGFSPAEAGYPSLAFSPSGQPYIAYTEYQNSQKATVMKFDGTNWVYVGSEGFSAGEAGWTSLAFSPSGEPYVAYEDWTNSQKATVMKFDGANWLNIGNAGFSEGGAQNTSLAFSPSGLPFVAYLDWANSEKATVMKYDSVFVGINEQQKSKLLLYPNPATDKITLEASETIKESYLVILNIEGQELFTRQITQPKTQLDISSLSSGVYFVRLTGERTVQVEKFVKQ